MLVHVVGAVAQVAVLSAPHLAWWYVLTWPLPLPMIKHVTLVISKMS